MKTIELGRVMPIPRGEYDNGMSYKRLDYVTFEGSSYIAVKDTLGNIPSNTDFWQLMSARGETGSQGLQGIQGDTGPVGPPLSDSWVNIPYTVNTDVFDDASSWVQLQYNAGLKQLAFTSTGLAFKAATNGKDLIYFTQSSIPNFRGAVTSINEVQRYSTGHNNNGTIDGNSVSNSLGSREFVSVGFCQVALGASSQLGIRIHFTSLGTITTRSGRLYCTCIFPLGDLVE